MAEWGPWLFLPGTRTELERWGKRSGIKRSPHHVCVPRGKIFLDAVFEIETGGSGVVGRFWAGPCGFHDVREIAQPSHFGDR